MGLGASSELSVSSAPGALVASGGAFLVGEGLISIFYSQDQQAVSTFGRISRIGIGLAMLGWVWSKSGS
jgi:hypothetical protein